MNFCSVYFLFSVESNNNEKCDFFRHKIKYLGFIFNKNSRKTDPENTSAIKNMLAPTNVKTLRSFLRFVSHYSPFLSKLDRVRAPLNNLLKNIRWDWSDACQSTFSRVKSSLSSNLLLTYYDSSMDIEVVSDAFNYGVRAIISHFFPDGSQKEIAYASRSLIPAERNYSQIEKEAIAFAIKGFHKMLYEHHFALIIDHVFSQYF